jgi:chitinase
LTHVNFAFAFFDPTTFQIAPMDAPSGELFSRFTALKAKANGLQAWISVGGWKFTDPGSTRSALSDMTSSSGNRQHIITGLLAFMNHYNFDGVNLDWEYPQADDRGGVTTDTANYVSLVTELRAALGEFFSNLESVNHGNS